MKTTRESVFALVVSGMLFTLCCGVMYTGSFARFPVDPVSLYCVPLPVLLLYLAWKFSKGSAQQQEETARRNYYAAFARYPDPLDEDAILYWPLVAVNPKLIGGMAIVCLSIFLGSLVQSSFGIVPSQLAGGIGVLMADRLMFRAAHPLDVKRWQKFWTAFVLSYWAAYLPLLALVLDAAPRRLIPFRNQAWTSGFLAYLVACAVGIAVGYFWMRLSDAKEKATMAEYLWDWHADQKEAAG